MAWKGAGRGVAVITWQLGGAVVRVGWGVGAQLGEHGCRRIGRIALTSVFDVQLTDCVLCELPREIRLSLNYGSIHLRLDAQVVDSWSRFRRLQIDRRITQVIASRQLCHHLCRLPCLRRLDDRDVELGEFRQVDRPIVAASILRLSSALNLEQANVLRCFDQLAQTLRGDFHGLRLRLDHRALLPVTLILAQRAANLGKRMRRKARRLLDELHVGARKRAGGRFRGVYQRAIDASGRCKARFSSFDGINARNTRTARNPALRLGAPLDQVLTKPGLRSNGGEIEAITEKREGVSILGLFGGFPLTHARASERALALLSTIEVFGHRKATLPVIP